jgi:hypothetical protein
MSQPAARSAGATDRRPSRYSGPQQVGTHRTGVVRGTGRAAAPRPLSAVHRPAASGHASRGAQRGGPVRTDLRLVTAPVPARAGRSRVPFVLLVLALLVGTTLSLLVLNTAIAVDSLKATALRQQNSHRVQEEQLLQQQVINGSTPGQLADEARRAGLVPAATPGYLVVGPHGSTLRGTPSPAPTPRAPRRTTPAASSPAALSPAASAPANPSPGASSPAASPPAASSPAQPTPATSSPAQAQGRPGSTAGGN